METDQHDVSNTSGGTSSVGGNPSVSEDVNIVDRFDGEAEKHGDSSLENPKNENHIYRQDIVKRNNTSLIGVVTEVAGDSDSESDITDDDDDSDSDDDEDDDEEEEVGEEEEGEEEGGEENEEDGNVENNGGNEVRKGEANASNDDNISGDSHKRDPLVADQVRVLWLDDSETTHHRNELKVVDRGFLHGDYVASASDPTGQVGLVVDVNITLDLLAPDGSIIKDVSSRDVKRVRDITAGDFVVAGPWLGRVDDALDDVTVLFDDGSICKVLRAEPLQLRPIAKNLLEDGHCPYHPDQRVRASSSVFKEGRWLSGRWKANKLEGTVIKVTVGSVYVHWIASAGYGPDSSVSPPEEQNPKNLKLLSCFSHANWQLGDWCLFPSLSLSSSVPLDKGLSKLRLQESDSGYTECDVEEVTPEESNRNVELMVGTGSMLDENTKDIDPNTQNNVSPPSSSCSSSLSVSKENTHESWHIHRKKLRKVVIKRDKKLRKKEENYERALLIVNTKTRVDVGWQDGTVVRGLESTLLIPIESPGDHDFVSEQYVIEKATDDNEETSEIRRVGVVISVNSKEKTARVNWLKQVARPEDPREFEKAEIVSVYELEGHPDFDYCYGDVVVRLSPALITAEGVSSDSGEKYRLSNALKSVKGDSALVSNDQDGAFNEEACNDFSNFSWVGNITGLRNGDIEVTWADGMVSTVGPQAIYVVGRDDDESIAGGSEINDAASWETVDDDEMNVLDGTEQEPSHEGAELNPETGEVQNSGINGPFGFAIGIIRMASGIFSRGRSHGDSESSGENKVQQEEEIHVNNGRASSTVSNSPDTSVIDVGGGHTKSEKGELAEVESENLMNAVGDSCNLRPNESDKELSSDGNLCSFKRFETAKDPSDHFFVGANLPGNSGRKWLKKIQRDWNILQSNLPDGIYVRVYEDRMDLIRAVIVGAYGTPYQDGLFFFDFHLPPEYPDVPPSVHYHSGGWRINPNLYEEGKVCLSLLNTWSGRGNEVWDPQSSSILQVLVSLQGLVLNSKPYFNEAGYDKQIGTAEGEKNSLSYNENTFLLNCKTIMYLIRKPPKDFEDLVRGHFKQRGYYILKACDAYMKGYLIGSLAKDASLTEKSEADATSVGFKLMLAKIVPKLTLSLNDVGADCHDFKHLH